MTCSYSHYLIRRSTTLNTELANPAGVYRMSWSLTLALGMSPSIPVCPLHQLVCTGQALLWFSVRGMAGCGRAVPHWNTAGSLDTDKWDGRSVNSCVIEKQIKEVLGLCQSEVGGVFCLSSLSVGSVLVTVLQLTGGPSSCLQFLSDVRLQKKNPEIVFFDMALMRARQKQHFCCLPVFLFWLFYFGMTGWGWCIQMRAVSQRSCSSEVMWPLTCCEPNTHPKILYLCWLIPQAGKTCYKMLVWRVSHSRWCVWK